MKPLTLFTTYTTLVYLIYTACGRFDNRLYVRKTGYFVTSLISTEHTGIPCGWKLMLCGSHCDENRCCGS